MCIHFFWCHSIYDNATASIQIDGHRYCPIPDRSPVRQGCPISTHLFAMRLNPLLCTLENNLSVILIGQRRIKITVVAYADDVTIFVTSPTVIPKIQEALHCFEEASGGESKYRKINGTRDRSMGHVGTDYGHPVSQRGKNSGLPHNEKGAGLWPQELDYKHGTNTRKAQDAYCRDLSLDKRIQYVHDYLMARVWYLAQIYPPSDECGRNISPDERGGEAGTNYRIPKVPGADQVARVFVFIDRSVFFDLQMDPFRPSPSLCN